MSQDANSVTLGWTPQPGYGYLFSADGQLVSRTNDPSRNTARFSKGAAVYKVASIVEGNSGTYPAVTPPPPKPACSDGIDNDSDGKIDYPADTGCSSATDTDEFNSPPAQCADGTDNDGDGKIDLADPGCTSVTDNDETDPVPPPPPGYPDATNTGVPPGTTLTPSGGITISANNATVSGITTSGSVNITGAGVTLKNSKVGEVLVYGAAGNTANPRVTISDVEIDCGGPGSKGVQGSFGDHFQNVNLVRVNIHNCEDGLFAEGDFTVTDSFIHDLATCGSCHNDGMQIFGGSRITIEHNRIYGSDTSAIQFCNNTTNCSPMSNTLINNNLLAGGGWTLYCPKVSTSNFRITNNHFSTIFYPKVGGFGAATDCGGEIQSGNVIHETGQPITLG